MTPHQITASEIAVKQFRRSYFVSRGSHPQAALEAATHASEDRGRSNLQLPIDDLRFWIEIATSLRSSQ